MRTHTHIYKTQEEAKMKISCIPPPNLSHKKCGMAGIEIKVL
jgi:hypothetical protein